MRDMIAAALHGDVGNALILNNKLMPLHQKLFVEANPIPVKWALQHMGLIESGIRLPLVELSAANHALVREALQHADIA
jgi:dihydrodipicolinate synthase/N-acetylneuraminate lyase